MSVDYTKVFDLVVNILTISFPFALIFTICGKLVNTLLSFISGDRRVKL